MHNHQQATHTSTPTEVLSFGELFNIANLQVCQKILLSRDGGTLVISVEECDMDRVCEQTRDAASADEAESVETEPFRQIVPPTNCTTPEQTAAEIWTAAWFELTQLALKEKIETVIVRSPKGEYKYSPEVLATTREYRSRLLLEKGIEI
jgi:hypothetical protein